MRTDARSRTIVASNNSTGRAFKATPVRDRLVALVDRRPGTIQAEARRLLVRNVSSTVSRPIPAMLPWRQRDVLALMVDARQELTLAQVVESARQRDPRASYPAVRGAVTKLVERHAIKRRPHRGRYLYRPKANALQWLDVLDESDW